MTVNSKWQTKRLGELAEFRNGVNYNKDSFGVGVKVVGVSDFQNYSKPRYAELEQINPEGIVTERHLLRDGDIVFVRSNGNRELIGRSLFIDRPPETITHSAFTIRLRFITRDVLPVFYAYCFRTRLIRQALTAQGGGTNINNLNQDILGALEVPVPPLPTQQRIASILSAYDDLIENSQRRIKILEEMARALYREWFVHFRFPGGGSEQLIELQTGPAPARWRTGPLASFLSVLETGSRPKGGVGDIGEGVPSIGAESIVGIGQFDFEKTKYVPREFFEEMRSGVLNDRDVLVYKDGGRPGIFIPHVTLVGAGFPFDEMAINSHVYRVRAVEGISQEYLFLYLSSEPVLHWMHLHGSGAAIPSIARADLKRLPFVMPDAETLTMFNRFVTPLVAQILMAARQTQNLRRTRDLLLPHLLSGKVQLTAP